MNKPEAKLWFEVLNKKQIFNYRFLRQKPIDNYIVDFYCHKLRLAIEVDGISHADQPVYDQLRTETLLSLGIKILRYSNWQILEDIHSVANDIVENIRQRERVLKINPSDQLRRSSPLLKGSLISGKKLKGFRSSISIIPLPKGE